MSPTDGLSSPPTGDIFYILINGFSVLIFKHLSTSSFLNLYGSSSSGLCPDSSNHINSLYGAWIMLYQSSTNSDGVFISFLPSNINIGTSKTVQVLGKQVSPNSGHKACKTFLYPNIKPYKSRRLYSLDFNIGITMAERYDFFPSFCE